MRIGLNALLCSSGRNYRRTGVSRYIDELVRHLAHSPERDELFAYVSRSFEPVGWDGVRLRRARVPVEKPPVRIGWEAAVLPFATLRDRLGVYHGTVNTLPAGIRAATAVTVHDLAFLHYPEQITAKRYQYLKRMIRYSVGRADVVLVPSEATKGDVVDAFRMDPDRVVVTPLGVDARFQPVSGPAVSSVRKLYVLQKPFILSVGTLEPRKNLPMLVRAFAALHEQFPHDLVLAGPEGWLMDEIERTIAGSGIGDRVHRIGFIDDQALVALYSGADVVAIPSLYEGFGLPVLEAMASGAPVLTSNVSSLPEVAGDAAVLVDPANLDSVVDGLRQLLTSDELRARLRAAGPTQAAPFTWERTAALTRAAYQRIA
jgi:glycosyltransferase involved in cell wall biosynthesis